MEKIERSIVKKVNETSKLYFGVKVLQSTDEINSLLELGWQPTHDLAYCHEREKDVNGIEVCVNPIEPITYAQYTEALAYELRHPFDLLSEAIYKNAHHFERNTGQYATVSESVKKDSEIIAYQILHEIQNTFRFDLEMADRFFKDEDIQNIIESLAFDGFKPNFELKINSLTIRLVDIVLHTGYPHNCERIEALHYYSERCSYNDSRIIINLMNLNSEFLRIWPIRVSIQNNEKFV